MQAGGHDCAPVEEPPDDLVCPICLLPSKEPHLISCCGRKMCHSCISQVQNDNQPCPVCRAVKFDTMIDRQVERHVLELKVYCKNKDKGCTWTGEIRQLQQHCQLCIYHTVSCIYSCGFHCSQLDMFSHERDTCEARPAAILQKEVQHLEERIAFLEKKCDAKDLHNEQQRRRINELRQTNRKQEMKLSDSEEHIRTILKENDDANERFIKCTETKEELESNITYLNDKLSVRKKTFRKVRTNILTLLEENCFGSDGDDDIEVVNTPGKEERLCQCTYCGTIQPTGR